MMIQRTTIKTLRVLVETLNLYVGKPITAYAQSRAIVGCYVLDCANGGYRLAQIVSEGGGERDITPRYGAAVTADLIRAYIDGIMMERAKAA